MTEKACSGEAELEDCWCGCGFPDVDGVWGSEIPSDSVIDEIVRAQEELERMIREGRGGGALEPGGA